MSLKEKLYELRDQLFNGGLVSSGLVKSDKEVLINESINLDDKVDEFIKWYYENMVKGHYTDIGEYHQPRRMRDFIEKMAVWYELRYPEYEVNRLMHCSGQEDVDINDVMFNSNHYVDDLFDENADIRYLDWAEFYNVDSFIKSLPWEERCLFSKPRYRSLVHLDPLNLDSNYRRAHLHLTRNGFVKESEYVGEWSNFVIKDKELERLHVKKVVALFKERGIALPENNELEKTIKNVDNLIYQKEEMLNCVMYRIIERGGNRIGPRRAFLFAKEFGRNKGIPMMYGVDRSDPGLRLFINEYIKAGGSKDLICYKEYFSRASKDEKVDTISIQELILTHNNDAATFYTPEEHELHQKLVDALATNLDQEEIKRNKVMQLRLERKLKKSRVD